MLRSYFAFASDGEKYKSDKFEYSPENFKEAGASAEFVEQYLKVHSRMRKMSLKVMRLSIRLVRVRKRSIGSVRISRAAE